MKRRYNPENPDIAGEVPILATAIDPRYHNLKFLNTQQQVSIHEKLIELSENMPDDSQDQEKSDNTSEPPAKRSCPDTALEFLFGNYFVEEETSVGISEELYMFVKEPTASPETNPLEWWKVNQYRFPLLKNVAKRLLSIPATSVPSERIFSTSGLIVSKLRASLNPENVVFLNKNLPKTPLK